MTTAPDVNEVKIFDFARVFAEEGFHVFPLHGIKSGTNLCTCGDPLCKSPGKHPKTADGFKAATTDIAQITAWFAGAQDTNIGIATGKASGIVVVDLDSGKGGDAKELQALGVDPTAFSTLRVQTGQGSHFYYKYPENTEIKNSASKLAKHVDVRADGGYVVAPPSRHVSGREYGFLDSEAEMLEFPEAWLRKLQSSPQPKQHTAGSPNGNGNGNGQPASNNGDRSFVVPPPDPGLRVPQLIDFGSRNNTLIKLAGLLRHHGFSEGAIYGALSVENARVVRPPLSDAEIHAIARSVSRYQPAHTIGPVTDYVPDLLTVRSVNEWIEDAKNTAVPRPLFGTLWGESEVAIFFGDTGVGKSLLAVQIGHSISSGTAILGFDPPDAQTVLYIDLELSKKQFEARYSEEYQNHFRFSERFLRAEINLNSDLPDGVSFEDHLNRSIEKKVRESGTRVLIVDNISYLGTETEKSAMALPLMKILVALKRKYSLALLVLAHTPKRDDSRPLHLNDLAGSKALSNFADNVFGIGKSFIEPQQRYVKELKNRSHQIALHDGNVLLCGVNKNKNFLGLEFSEFCEEKEHLATATAQRSPALAAAIAFLKRQLAGGAKYANFIFEDAEKEGITAATLRRAKSSLKVISAPESFQGKIVWKLPVSDEQDCDAGASHAQDEHHWNKKPSEASKNGASTSDAHDEQDWRKDSAVLSSDAHDDHHSVDAENKGTYSIASSSGAQVEHVTPGDNIRGACRCGQYGIAANQCPECDGWFR